jgi:predicted Zn-dependent protease
MGLLQRQTNKIISAVAIFIATMALFIPQGTYAVPFISEETEISLGKNADLQVVQLYGIYQDKKLQLYVNEIGQKLVANLSDKIFPRFHFKLVDSPEINAFALPGGYVYVTRGLLAALNSEAELANVLGHEIAHVTLHHGAKMMVRSIAAQILSIGGAIASPKNAGEWLMVSTAMFQQINMGYGREAELESDAQGMLTATTTGYDPRGMVSFLRNLRRHEIMSGQAYHSFQASHPDTRERIIKSDGLGESFLNRNPEVSVKREEYLLRLQGMAFGGKKHSKDTKSYEPEFVQVYRVQPGDTFQSIAEKELGDARKDLDLSVLNGRKESSQPVPGELIKIIQKGVYKPNKILRLQGEN